ncbi:MAG: 23S rRNA (adenine(2030)-N(6))-methyltransferase RlmJ [Alphaproteobacteria bacterium]|nr:23S rRNA (adenine(2030)-N(6))-methyltransferase RlmJ [Alphaproteobacteria bacterium]MBM3952673.1 23S rRNA (adenine(2030)-N(6))-methyltransferase RlmJ [Rhodospirillales bacterium]
MNYRHAYHAGNFADVFKHAGLALIVDYLKKKPAPFAVVDTHAGLGRYDLSAPEAEKTGEWRQGIGRVLESPPDLPGLASLLKAVVAVNGGHKPSAAHMPRYYPGSPRVARTLLRKSDKLWCAELHPEDARALAREFRGDGQVEIRRMDGYEAIRAWLPPLPRANPRGESTMAAGIRPPPKRGVVLIDPPFEQRDEFDHLLRGLKDGHRRFATGIFVLWYPIKSRAPVDRFHAALAESAIRRILAAELLIHRLDNSERLNGCGLIVVNPPWRLDSDLARLVAGLAGLFAPDEGASSVAWLAGE